MMWGSQGIPRFLIALIGVLVLVPVSDPREQAVVLLVLSWLTLARFCFSPGRYEGVCCRLFGILLPVVPWLGPHTLSGYAVWFFALHPSDIGWASRGMSWRSLAWSAPILGYLLGSVGGELIDYSTMMLPSSVGSIDGVRIDGWARLVDILRSALDVQVPSWRLFSRVFLAVVWISFFSEQRDARSKFVHGLALGTGFSAAFAIAQWAQLLPVSLPNQTTIWDSLQRPSGLMTDPNALGVVLALVVWMVFLEPAYRWLSLAPKCLWFLVVLVAGAVSGSRTFLLSCAFLLLVIAWRWRRRWVFLGAASCALGAVGLVTLLDGKSDIVEALVASQDVPMGLRRGLAALSLLRLEDTFMSRSVFVQFANEIGKGHWIFGVGADRFISYVPLVGAEQNLVRGWSDNSNNLYLGMLVELGLIGVGAFVFALFGRTPCKGANKIGFVGCLVMLGIIGCTGPHTDFMEVLLIVAVLIAITSKPRETNEGGYALAMVAMFLLGCVSSGYRERGVYGWTHASYGALRWLSPYAKIELVCEAQESGDGQATLLLRPRYIPQTEPLRVTYGITGGPLQELSLRTQDVQQVTIPCAKAANKVFVRVATRPPWSPYRAWPRTSRDRRILGVEQVYRAPIAGVSSAQSRTVTTQVAQKLHV